MAPRARRDWDAMRADIRALIRETSETDPYWTNALLLQLFNQNSDKRFLDLAEAHEGWVTFEDTQNLVANTREYALPEGTGRVKRVVLVSALGDGMYEVPLQRQENWSETVTHNVVTTTGLGYRPTYRFLNNASDTPVVVLEPRPTVAVTNGLRLELEYAPGRLADGGDKLPLYYPDIMETMLILDTACDAMAVENTQGNLPPGVTDSTRKDVHSMRADYERRFLQFIQVRSEGRVFSTPHRLGD